MSFAYATIVSQITVTGIYLLLLSMMKISNLKGWGEVNMNLSKFLGV